MQRAFAASAAIAVRIGAAAAAVVGAGVGAATPPAASDRALETASANPPIQLPSYTVTDSRILPALEAWRYAKIGAFEILSSASDRDTRRIVDDFLRFHEAVAMVWPTVQLNAEVPATLILCNRVARFAEFAPASDLANIDHTLSLCLQSGGEAAIVINLENSGAGASFADEGGGGSDYAQQLLHGEFVHFLISRIGPRTPPWLENALTRLFTTMKQDSKGFSFPGIADPGNLAARRAFAEKIRSVSPAEAARAAAADKDCHEALSRGTLIPLAHLFSADGEWGQEALSDPVAIEGWEFTRFCLFSGDGRYRAPFIEFAFLCSHRNADEALFRRCFKMGYDEMLALVWASTDWALTISFKLAASPSKEGSRSNLELRAANDAEQGRIKGEALLMAGRSEDAHWNLIAPYQRGSREPELLSALGLEERTEGRDDRAVKFLEAAVAGGTTRSRAYLELAQLRLAAADAHPGGAGGRIDVDQLAGVLKPLFAGRVLKPAIADIYTAIATAWSHSQFSPQSGHLAVVDQGVRLFPYDSKLVYADARLKAQCGRPADAAALCQVGIEFAASEGDRRRFEELQSSLRLPLPAPAAPPKEAAPHG